jgi:CRP/FNR family transcriptional regulator
MSDSARFALHRPEFLGALVRGEEKIAALVKESSVTVPVGAILVEANTDHQFVYRLLKGWAGRTRLLPDGRNQFILIFLPGDLFAVKSMFLTRQTDANCTMPTLQTATSPCVAYGR